jgi:FkbM family methyltransferase
VDDKLPHHEPHQPRQEPLSEQPIRQIFRARHRALRAGARASDARDAESVWLDVCPAYRAAKASPAPADVDAIDSEGLTIVVPRATSATRFGARLRSGWLPWKDILAQRELGVGTAMIDIGANIGTTSLLRVIAGDIQRAYAVEPEPANYSCLVQNILTNGLAGFVLPDSCAISSHTGEALLRQATGLGAHRLMTEKAFRHGRRDTVVVQTSTLDDWIRDRRIDPDTVSFVKVDTQGWESHVLAGAIELLARRHIAWVLEVSPRHLSAAGTPLADLLNQIRAHFTHAIDLRADRTKSRVVPVHALAEQLAYLDDGEGSHAYTNLVLYHES